MKLFSGTNGFVRTEKKNSEYFVCFFVVILAGWLRDLMLDR